MIAFVGDADSLLPYGMLGFKTLEADSPAEASGLLAGLDSGGYRCVFITEDLMEGLEERDYPFYLMAIPGIRGSRGLGKKHVDEMLKKALGTENISGANK